MGEGTVPTIGRWIFMVSIRMLYNQLLLIIFRRPPSVFPVFVYAGSEGNGNGAFA